MKDSDSRGWSTLHYAALGGDPGLIQGLLEQKADAGQCFGIIFQNSYARILFQKYLLLLQSTTQDLNLQTKKDQPLVGMPPFASALAICMCGGGGGKGGFGVLYFNVFCWFRVPIVATYTKNIYTFSRVCCKVRGEGGGGGGSQSNLSSQRAEHLTQKRRRPLSPEQKTLPNQPQNPKTPKPQNPKTPKPQNPKTPKPQNPKTPKPQNPKTPKPQNPKTPKPQNPKTPKPQNPKTPKPRPLNPKPYTEDFE